MGEVVTVMNTANTVTGKSIFPSWILRTLKFIGTKTVSKDLIVNLALYLPYSLD
jgi:hypothetical protein